MGAPLEAQGPGAADATPAVWLARVATPPVGGTVGVVVPDFSGDRVYPRCAYEPHGATPPAVGTIAYVAFSNGAPVIVHWEGPAGPLAADTTGLTSAQIDALFTPAPPDGATLVDSVNHLYLRREGGKWYKSATLTLIP